MKKKSELQIYLFKEMIEGRKMPLLPALRLAAGSIFDPFKMFVIYAPGPIGFTLRRLWYRRSFMHYGKNSLIDVGVVISGEENISIGENTIIDRYTRLDGILGKIKIGDGTHIAQNCVLGAGDELVVGNNVRLAPGVRIFTNSEVSKDGKRMSGPMVPERHKAFMRAPVTVREHAFIGSNAFILPGVTIGEHAVVGAHSLVSRNIPSWTIVSGIPARVVAKIPRGDRADSR